MNPAVFGYIRVSQAEGASGLATQRRILTDHGLRDDRIFTDVASGRNMRRPAWTTLRETLQPGDVVVVPRGSTAWRVTSPRVSGPSRSCTPRASTSAPLRRAWTRGTTAWCVATAAFHQGKPNQYSHVEHWEVRNGNSITISRTESGDYKPDRHHIWVDSDHVPVMGFAERFPSLDEAMEWVRQAVDEESRLEADYQRELRELRDALESTLDHGQRVIVRP